MQAISAATWSGAGVPTPRAACCRVTWSLFALVGAIYFVLGASDLAADTLKPRVVETVLYLFTAAALWWFGARQIEKRRPREGMAGR